MTQEQREPTPSFEKYELPESVKSALHEEITNFAEAYSLPPRVAESLFEKLLHEKWPTDGHIVAAQIKELLNELA